MYRVINMNSITEYISPRTKFTLIIATTSNKVRNNFIYMKYPLRTVASPLFILQYMLQCLTYFPAHSVEAVCFYR